MEELLSDILMVDGWCVDCSWKVESCEMEEGCLLICGTQIYSGHGTGLFYIHLIVPTFKGQTNQDARSMTSSSSDVTTRDWHPLPTSLTPQTASWKKKKRL